MMYACNLNTGQHVYIENRGTQTLITLASSTLGQQQSQRSGFATGEWVAPPALFRTAAGIVLRIETNQGNFFFQVQSSGVNTLSTAPALGNADVMSLQQVDVRDVPHFETIPPIEPMKPMEPMEPMKPMEPMEPMKPMEPMQMRMGNMQMQMEPMKPMQMRMGNMQMQMGDTQQPQSAQQPDKRFCSQCGHPVDASDQFCSKCGHRLTPFK